ncbi:MAG: AbrB/MazE/SpoVT family DNA-binding domain-containing protein [Nanoarchaeota archaeon]|nr:AbrB/MazE/SpoVT family DNA-binding domain-containing protein [Nanoarchaeota archaeon]
MGDEVTKLGQAKISPQWYLALIREARPYLNVKKGDYLEFHVENGEVIIRKKKEEK